MSQNPQPYDVIVLGAGGAGLMCAAVAGQRGQSVLLLDHAEKAGKKILISGGGRCNFTNRYTPAECFLSDNPHFARSALSRYGPQNFIDLVERYGIAWHEKTLGQLFCDGSSMQIVKMLLQECADGSVDLRVNHSVRSIEHMQGLFALSTDEAEFSAPALVVATGGPSIPKMGATGFAYDVARQFKLKVVEPRPALVPFTLASEDAMFKSLSGVSSWVCARSNEGEFEEAALFTHKGLSGPAILQISSYWRHGDAVNIDFLSKQDPHFLVRQKRENGRVSVAKALTTLGGIAERLALELCSQLNAKGTLADIKDAELSEFEKLLRNWQFIPNGTEGFAKAEVTIGGVSTAELSSRTMESKRRPGLYFVGEAVDVTGWLGGYNFQWAWSSGTAAGNAIGSVAV